NPCLSTEIVYNPTGSEEKANTPESVVVWVLVIPVASFFAVTVAPGTTDPVVSLTVPVMLDEPVCPYTFTAQPTNRIRAARMQFRRINFNMGFLLAVVKAAGSRANGGKVIEGQSTNGGR